MQDVRKTIQYAYFHSAVTYGMLFWGNSSHNMEDFRLHNKIIRIMMGARSRDFCREIFLNFRNITFNSSIHIFCKCVFVVSNREYFMENSELYDVKTRNKKNLFQPQSNLSINQRGPHYACIQIYVYNNVPTQIQLLSSNFNQFKKARKDFLQLHSFYTLAEYLNYDRD